MSKKPSFLGMDIVTQWRHIFHAYFLPSFTSFLRKEKNSEYLLLYLTFCSQGEESSEKFFPNFLEWTSLLIFWWWWKLNNSVSHITLTPNKNIISFLPFLSKLIKCKETIFLSIIIIIVCLWGERMEKMIHIIKFKWGRNWKQKWVSG